jgi:serine phosphatase RsbU (regulator of sigma subunit)/CHASE3 domain sensor protein
MNLKIKGKLFLSFILVCSFAFLFSLISIWVFNKRNKISELLNELDEIHLLTMEEYKLQQDYLLYESINQNYFRTGNSTKLIQQKHVFEKLIRRTNLLNAQETSKELFEPTFFNAFILEQNLYQQIFASLTENVKKRGFKDFGLEGEMRMFAHELMKIQALNQVNVLMLRRHEKDFIIRKEERYYQQFNALIKKVKKEVDQNSSLPLFQKLRIDSIINGYSGAFSAFVKTEWELNGNLTKLGLTNSLWNQHNKLINLLKEQKKLAAITELKLQQNLMLLATIMVFVIIILSIVFSYHLAHRLSGPVLALNNYIDRFVASKFANIPLIQSEQSKDEISQLSDNFFKMAVEITSYIKFFEEKVKERTAEVNKQHNEIVIQKTKIGQQYEQLVSKTELLEYHQKLLIEKNKNILDSLRYAERIQRALMPSKILFHHIVPDAFIYFQPKDIVSGDFYFTLEMNENIYFAVADCTGHGVPGAFVSIVGIHAIHRALNEFKLIEPSDILNKVNEIVEKDISSYGETIINDGMDIALCKYDKKNKTLSYSGANLPVWIVEQEITEDLVLAENFDSKKLKKKFSTSQIREIKGDNQPIGHIQNRTPFTNHALSFKKGSMLYIFSDGYADQFGGPAGKKYKYTRLRNLLLEINEFPVTQQKQLVKDAFVGWKGDSEQVDDVCVLGIRL